MKPQESTLSTPGGQTCTLTSGDSLYARLGYTLRYMEAWLDIWGTHTPTLMEWGTFLGFSLAQATLEVMGKLVGV